MIDRDSQPQNPELVALEGAEELFRILELVPHSHFQDQGLVSIRSKNFPNEFQEGLARGLRLPITEENSSGVSITYLDYLDEDSINHRLFQFCGAEQEGVYQVVLDTVSGGVAYFYGETISESEPTKTVGPDFFVTLAERIEDAPICRQVREKLITNEIEDILDHPSAHGVTATSEANNDLLGTKSVAHYFGRGDYSFVVDRATQLIEIEAERQRQPRYLVTFYPNTDPEDVTQLVIMPGTEIVAPSDTEAAKPQPASLQDLRALTKALRLN